MLDVSLIRKWILSASLSNFHNRTPDCGRRRDMAGGRLVRRRSSGRSARGGASTRRVVAGRSLPTECGAGDGAGVHTSASGTTTRCTPASCTSGSRTSTSCSSVSGRATNRTPTRRGSINRSHTAGVTTSRFTSHRSARLDPAAAADKSAACGTVARRSSHTADRADGSRGRVATACDPLACP